MGRVGIHERLSTIAVGASLLIACVAAVQWTIVEGMWHGGVHQPEHLDDLFWWTVATMVSGAASGGYHWWARRR